MRTLCLALVVAGSLGLAACATTSTAGSAPTPVPPASTSAAAPTTSPGPSSSPVSVAVPDILRFTATTVDGTSFAGAKLAGRPAVLWFWAAWCAECRSHAAAVRELQSQYADRVGVVGVAGLGSGAAAMLDFVADYQLTGFPQLADDTGTVWQRFQVPRQDYYVILDRSGTVVHSGPLPVEQVKQKIDALL